MDVTLSQEGYQLALANGEEIILVSVGRTDKEWLTLTGHSDHITEVIFNHQGTKLASASWDGSIRIWEVSNGEQLLTIETETTSWGSMAFDPMDEVLASGGSGGIINLWNVESGRKQGSLQGSGMAPVSSIAFNPSGLTLASGHGMGLWLINLETMQRDDILTSIATNVVEFDNVGNYIAAKTDNGYILLWNANTYETIPMEQAIDDQIFTNGLSFNPIGTIIAVKSDTGIVRFWNTETGREEEPLRTGKPLAGIRFTPDGMLFVSAHTDGTIILWGVPLNA